MDALAHRLNQAIIRETAPDDPALRALFEHHLTLMRASSPACSVHAMDARDLREAGARFFALSLDHEPLGMGALKRLSGTHGELKSMHVSQTHRGQGLAGKLLSHLIEAARSDGLERLSLETGSQPAFEPARRFYAAHSFELCEPFEGYTLDPASVFMTRAI
jgi:putative acetyltransferase